MMEVELSPQFKKAVKGLPLQIRKKLESKLRVFSRDWRDPSLKTHKLKGKLSHAWAFRVTYSIRVLFIFVGDEVILLLDIGEHDEMYGK